MFGPRSLAVLLVCVTLGACSGGPEMSQTPTTPRTLVPAHATIWVQPGKMGTVEFALSGPTGAPLPGQMVTFTIVDDPQTPGAEAQGATLASASAVTDADGRCAARVTAGALTVFRVRAVSADASAEVVVVVDPGDLGAVDVAPFFPPGSRAAGRASTLQILFFDNSACRDIPLRRPPQPARTMRSLSAAAGAVTRYEFVSTAVGHAIVGRAIDARGAVLALGCTDLPGPTLVAGGAVQIALRLVDIGPDPVGRFSATTTLDVTPPLAAAAAIAATWSDLTDCPLDPAQRWLDCTIDALGPTSDADPVDCVPASAPGGDGPLGDALGALRGTLLPGPDGKATACRGPKTGTGAVSADATVQGLFGSPRPAALIHLEEAADDAAHLFDSLRVRSTLVLGGAAAPTGTLDAIALTHTLDSILFRVPSATPGSPGATAEVPLLPLGLPALSALVTAGVQGSTLTIPEHAFTIRLGTASRAAFGGLGLTRRGLPADSQSLVAAIAGLAKGDEGAVSGCVALDAALCVRVSRPNGCLAGACASGLDALATRLDASFDAADGETFDLYLAGTAPLLDTHGNGLADRLGDAATPAGVGTWTVDLRPKTGRRTLPATWEAIREGN